MDPPKPRGRGAKIAELLAKAKAAQPGAQPEPPEEAPKPRGRAAFLNKLKEMKITSPGIEPGITVPDSVSTSTPTVVTPVKEEEKPEKPIAFYRGSAGQQVYVTANYIKLAINKDKGVFEYEVRFHPPVDAKNARIRLINANMEALGNVKMFDGGSCLYLPIKLPQERTVFSTAHPTSGEMIQITIIYKRSKRYGECLHLFNVLFKRVMSALQFSRVGRNYFDSRLSKQIPQHRLEVLPGYAIAVDEFEGGLMLCLDTQHRVLRTSTVLEYLIEIRNANPDNFRKLAYDNIIGSVVITKYNNKTYVIDEILWDASPKDTFLTDSGQNISFMEYYESHHGLKVTQPNQPLLLHLAKKKMPGQAKEQEFRISLMPEFCHLTGLTDVMRNDFRVMKDVAEFTRLSPHQRMNALRKYLQNVKSDPAATKILSDWGVEIQDATIDLNARILEPEKIIFGSGAITSAGQKADWNVPVSKNKVVGPVDLKSWVVIFTERDQRTAQEFATNMTRLSDSIGCRITHPIMKMVKNDRTATYREACEQVINDHIQCVVFICPSMRADLYSIIKKITLVQRPVGSQVILTKSLTNQKKVRNITLKVALQINCKLGGSLWALKIPVKTWMVCGIDVYHSAGNKYSWGALVCSTNESLTTYYTSVIKQEKELSDALKVPFKKALLKWRENLGAFPAQIVVYRDGVSDGQMSFILQYEVQQFLDVLKELDTDVNICYIVVQKRISTRIISRDGGGNPAPGTIVDTEVTKRHYCDFYLVPQNVNQGTVSPTHYVIVYDSANLNPDHVQKLTYKMCHLYYNWCGTIRVPAPCQYAHKVAFLVGQHVGQEPADILNDKLYFL